MKPNKKVELSNRISGFVELKNFCTFSMGEFSESGHYLEVTEWTNEEGFDLEIHDISGESGIKMSWGQFEALEACVNEIRKKHDLG